MAHTYVSGVSTSNHHIVKYRYICEHCRKDSGWKRYKVSGTGTTEDEKHFNVNEGKVTIKNDAVVTMLEKRALSDLNKNMNNEYNDVKCNNYTSFDGKCPHCKKRQTWELASFASIFMMGLGMGLVLGVGVAFMTTIVRFVTTFTNVEYKVFDWIILKIFFFVFGVIFIVLTIYYFIVWWSIYKDVKNVVNVECPEIDWNWDFSVKKTPSTVDRNILKTAPSPVDRYTLKTAPPPVELIRKTAWYERNIKNPNYSSDWEGLFEEVCLKFKKWKDYSEYKKKHEEEIKTAFEIVENEIRKAK